MTEDGQFVGKSTTAATQGISMVVLSRIGMAAPGMMGIPIVMDKLEKKGVLKKYPRIQAPLQVLDFIQNYIGTTYPNRLFTFSDRSLWSDPDLCHAAVLRHLRAKSLDFRGFL